MTEIKNMKTQQDSDGFIGSILDSLTSQIAVLNEHGIIIAVNKAWKEFGKENVLPEPQLGFLGVNYLDACKNADNRKDGNEATAAQQGILAVLAGEQEVFHLEYPCQQRWFSMSVSPLRGPVRGVVISHENITARKLAEIAMRDSESRFSAIIEASPIPKALNDAHGNITYLNQAFIQTLGYTLADIPTLTDWWPRAYPDPQYQQWVAENWQNHLAEAISHKKPFQPMEVIISCKNGNIRTFLVSASDLKDNFSGTHLVTLYDITERKIAEQQLAESEAKMAAILENVGAYIFLKDCQGRYTFANQACLKLWGVPLEKVLGVRDEDLFDPQFAATIREHDHHVLAKGESIAAEEVGFALKTGKTAIYWAVKIPLRDANGNIYGLCGISTDITERKKMEDALIASEKEFRQLAESMPQIVWISRADGQTIYFNQQWTDYTGLSREESYGDGWLKPFHPDDQKRAWDSWQNAIHNNGIYSLECKLRNVDGVYRWWLIRGVPVFGEKGKVSKWFGTCTDIHEIKKAEETIYELAFYDPLTHLPNRRLMLDRLKQSLISRTLKSRYGAILFINLDNFRTLNDSKGHAVGDLLLVAVSQHLQSTVHEDDTVSRVGSDEFVILLDALDIATDLAASQAESVAKRVLNALNRPFNLQGYEYSCSACIGISLFRGNDFTVDELIKQADLAMHQSKQAGSNIISFFDPMIEAALESRVQLESWMRKALNEQYQLYYQIQVDKNGKPAGAESLIRWHHPEQGIISPADFIPLAEETGLILAIGQWVLETACAQLKNWENHQHTRHLVLAVNVSAKQFGQPNFVEQVLTILEQTGAPADKLKLELTESMLVNNIEEIIIKMNELKAKGVKFSLYDFGTGFSSLTYLKRLPFDQLKIDQSFVRDALTDPNDAAITRTIITLGQSLEMEVIAEGVETEEHRGFLAAHGCHHYQGFLFSRPLPLEAFEQLLSNPSALNG